jgi:hypothetical protein
MKITLPKDFIYQLLFFASVFVPYLNNYELTFSVWSLATLATFQNKLSLEILKHLACYIGIFLIAVFSSFWYGVLFHDNEVNLGLFFYGFI